MSFSLNVLRLAKTSYPLFYFYNLPMKKINVFIEWGFFILNRNEATHNQQLSLTRSSHHFFSNPLFTQN